MAVNLEFGDDDDYIDMELSSSSPQSREFDFKMAFTCNVKEEAVTSPADELFYKGKLLPLLLHPRRLMVQNLHFPATTGDSALDISKLAFKEEDAYYSFSMPLRSCCTAPGTKTLNTPLGSCNISPSESRRVSCELNPDDKFFEWSSELRRFIRNDEKLSLKKKPWLKKFKLTKHYILGQKMKTSRAYLKSLFTKHAKTKGENGGAQKLQKVDESVGKMSEKKSNGEKGRIYYPTISSILKNIDRNGGNVEGITHRRSFSGAIKRRSPVKPISSTSSSSSSSSSSCASSINNSIGIQETELLFLRRSSSASEIENSIQAAIAHCKMSQQVVGSKTEPENQFIA